MGDDSDAKVKQVFRIDLTGAKEVTGLSGNLSSKAVTKTLALDFNNMLIASGVAAKNIPAKMEGLTFGDDIVYNNETLHVAFIANDNDFLSTITDSKHPLGFANTNNFYAVGFNDTDLKNYIAQKISVNVPEPSSLVLMCLGLLGIFGIRRR